ncbi:DDHD-domain-containing protein [Cucurbitaria berberidis CBS 394.84]|uniref:DDHD-domain-containing protein n=1 Tax=Cucurbitaria berberidis CBS 394.84 TaxID=1168544 RepID=A0A9P4L3F2_9PLEO|nr:DDHD-domain-containing protein [Cucurbitaria berberidis CBS 394.84]KAF1840244.1 DDHD-domain-containing protein [Cucurbitaria berberidis CBS 394.84]
MSGPDPKQGFLSNLSPWGSRAVTPKPPPTPKTAEVGVDKDKDKDKEQEKGKEAETRTAGPTPQQGGDHVVNPRHRLSLKRYPQDCPPLAVKWFHAVDLPKRKPLSSHAIAPDKALPKPKKWIPFSASDSRAIEAAFQKTADEDDAAELRKGIVRSTTPTQSSASPKPTTKVPVNEDYLFDVEIETRELAPSYWLGPVYDVKRGTWFTPDGEAVDEGLATQLEEGFLKVKPWRFGKPEENRSTSQPRGRPLSMGPSVGDDYRKELARLNRDSTSNPVTPKSSFGSLRNEARTQRHDAKPDDAPVILPTDSPRTYRLFGAYMNSTVTYQDENTAWLLTDDMWTRMGSTLYQRFAGGAHYAGYKYVRGYTDTKDKKKTPNVKDPLGEKQTEGPTTPSLAYGSDYSKPSTATTSEANSDVETSDNETGRESPSQTRRRHLERQVSQLMSSSKPEYEQKQEEELRKREEKEMRDDYKVQDKGEQGREIEHLLLITHGIGQRLGMRMESINFIHDVNTMRKSFKSVYAASPDLQALNSETDSETKNNRIQVIPIVWRHLLDFPKQSLKHNRKEHDLGDLDHEDHEYPNLEDITVEGVPAVRNFLTDLALDILLYQSPAYKGHITRIVVNELNRTYRLFKDRNPSFKGKVSLVGHSLGSAIMFDLLCLQKDPNSRSSSHSGKHRRSTEEGLKLDFEVEDFYALGSPLGLFQMLKGRTIAARPSSSFVPPKTPASPLDDPFSPSAAGHDHAFDITTSSPLCKQIFNIFHPTDPISYRIEPLISPAMSTLKAQPLPYTKKGIFGAPASQGLTGIGARVGQGVTDFWSSLGSGIASGLLNRSLGISGTEMTGAGNGAQGQRTSRPLYVGPSPNTSASVVPGLNEPASAFINEERRRRLAQEKIAEGEDGEHPPTLIESELDTLFAGFQNRRKSQQSEDGTRDVEKDLEWQELEERSRKLKKEEAKVRSLNSNGRVDYSIQEGAFDISLLASIASHLNYWADEDVSHFMISQLLARHRVFKPKE